MFEIIFYEKKNGKKPAEEFLFNSDVKMRAKLTGLLKILQEYGNMLREPYSKSLGNGIFEIRCKADNNISRVLYFFYANKKIILTNGFIKKSQKTPQNEIIVARKYRADYIERIGEME